MIQLLSTAVTKEKLQELVMGECMITRQARVWCLRQKEGRTLVVYSTPTTRTLALDMCNVLRGTMYGDTSVKTMAVAIVRKLLILIFRYLTFDDITSRLFRDRELALLLSYHVMSSQRQMQLLEKGHIPYYISI